MRKPFIIDPAFAVPLTPTQLHDLGVIAVVWGQIDFILDEIICHVHAFDHNQRATFVTDKQIAAKLDLLRSDYTRLPKRLHAGCADLIKRVAQIKQNRNSAFHGVWGWKWETRSKTRQVGAFHSRTKNNPLRPIQLAGMAEELISLSKLAGSIMADLHGMPFVTASQFTWGAEDSKGEPASWLRERYPTIQKGRSPTARRKRPRPPSPPKDEPR
ncbi:MAG: hypothetical protein ACT6RD_12970 [Brevundimonas sp.]|uniref:hypothetical protein n=1 Tax=Brevundimonas sp. TaxID=1871086 RepID=UPI00403324A5